MPKNPFDELDKKFKTSPTTALDKTFEVVKKEKNLPDLPPEIEADKDFQEARNILKRANVYAEDAIQGILNIAKNSDQPRAYEVAATLIKTLQDGAKDQIEIREKQKRVKGETDKKAAVTNNNLFVGSTKDLLNAIKGKDVDPKKIN
jgi:hypothetical protein